ncbi:MAG: hypothetical protein LBB50_07095 [Oscillospiraceae bacterium]|jgi:16S rRNA (cytosine967-C5)-methyltransferase|nr:hypothetical protein [Oscillospiraceae bacterium]
MPEALQLRGANVTQLPGFAEGHFHVQDLAAQLCCRALDPRPGNTVFDLCAAPGGKTFTLAEMMQDTGRVIAVDLHKNRVRLVAEGAARLGLRCVEPRQGDALRAADLPGIAGYADRVLCDVPCSGLGILRKKPDIREKLHTELDKLPEMQYAIVCAGAACVAQEGVLVYATCTLRPAENEEVCRRFLRAHPGFAALPVLPEHETGRRAPEGFLTLMPHLGGTDGFFIAKFGRKKESHD